MRWDINQHIWRHIVREVAAQSPVIALQGARRSGKTFAIMQFLLTQAYNEGDICLVASMSEKQGRQGSYDDGVTIVNGLGKGFAQYWELLSSPKEFRCKVRRDGRKGKITFASFKDPESAKGAAVDWLFINEANKFTWQQYLELAVNVRKGIFLDYNPNKRFWVDELKVKPLVCHWQDNVRFLSKAQLAQFDLLKTRAESPTASAMDLYFYRVYYLGEYGEMGGDIFNSGNTQVISRADVPQTFERIILFGDPSALRGADFFPLVVVGESKGKYYVLDVDSTNQGGKEERAKRLVQMAAQWDGCSIYIESNGLASIDFIEFCQKSEIPVNGWCSVGNKFDRIVSYYEDLTQNVYYVENERLDNFLLQIYDFGEKCEHDDNIDAVASALRVLKFLS